MSYISEWQSRTELLTGPKTLLNLKQKHVLIMGLGGVGAYIAEMLCRAGIGELTIDEGDQITSTNRNRQLIALKTTEGCYKTDLLEDRLKDINPEIRKKLNKLGVRSGFKVVFSTEKVRKDVIRLTDGEKNKKSVVGTISYMPPLFGIHMAGEIIKDFIDDVIP